jgi:AraC-like DNA-binding protein
MASAVEFIRSADEASLTLDEVARSVHLSPSRFAHLFTQELGLPFRRYLLWRKLTRAMLMVGRGNTLSAAAHGAGFSDSAHLTRTFYQMFGIAPTVMMGGGEFYEIPAPFEFLMPE